MKNPNKIVITILDEGVFPWWEKEDSELAEAYKKYYGSFEMEYDDYLGDPDMIEKPTGDHGFWVMDRLLQICGNPHRVKVVNGKVLGNGDQGEAILSAISNATGKSDLINMSLGIPKMYNVDQGWLRSFNAELDAFTAAGGLAIISAGNEGEVLSNGEVIDNTNWLAQDPDNNLSVGSHDESGQWDSFSSAGGVVDVSARGSDLKLLGERKFKTVSGTSFSAPAFCGVCGNYLLDSFSKLRGGETAKDIIYKRLSDAIKPVYSGRTFWQKFRTAIGDRASANPWFGTGSFEAYAKWFVKQYGRDVLREKTFDGVRDHITQMRIGTM